MMRRRLGVNAASVWDLAEAMFTVLPTVNQNKTSFERIHKGTSQSFNTDVTMSTHTSRYTSVSSVALLSRVVFSLIFKQMRSKQKPDWIIELLQHVRVQRQRWRILSQSLGQSEDKSCHNDSTQARTLYTVLLWPDYNVLLRVNSCLLRSVPAVSAALLWLTLNTVIWSTECVFVLVLGSYAVTDSCSPQELAVPFSRPLLLLLTVSLRIIFLCELNVCPLGWTINTLQLPPVCLFLLTLHLRHMFWVHFTGSDWAREYFEVRLGHSFLKCGTRPPGDKQRHDRWCWYNCTFIFCSWSLCCLMLLSLIHYKIWH